MGGGGGAGIEPGPADLRVVALPPDQGGAEGGAMDVVMVRPRRVTVADCFNRFSLTCVEFSELVSALRAYAGYCCVLVA